MVYYVWAQNRGISSASEAVSARKAARLTGDGSAVIEMSPVGRIRAKYLDAVLASPVAVTNAVQAVDEVAPEAVADLRAVDTAEDAGGSITLTWTLSPSDRMVRALLTSNAGYVTVPGVLSYEIYRALQGEDLVQIDSVPAGATSYVDADVTGLGPGSTYVYDVRAADASNEVASATHSAFAADNAATSQGDWSQDATVDIDDFLMFALAFGKTTEEVDPMFDLVPDGQIDINDFLEFALSFNQPVSVAKPVPMAFGHNDGVEMSLRLLEDATADLAIRVLLDKAAGVMGYRFTVRYDPAMLELTQATVGEGNLLTCEGGTTAPLLVSDTPGELTIANVLSRGDAAAGQGVAAEIFFTSKDDLGGTVRLSEGMVVDAALGMNVAALRSAAVVMAPKAFALLQNHPNPFNPATTIEYALPMAASVRLEVYNTLGQVVATLVNEKQDAGRYSVRWDGLNSNDEMMSSGVYFYRIVAGEFHDIRRMLLIK
jgi:hypothetical protein